MRARRTSGQDVLESRLAYTFSNRDFLVEALTHASATKGQDNQRLEFLGDALLNFTMARILFEAHPGWQEGPMSKLRGLLVCTEALSAWALDLGLDKLLSAAHPRKAPPMGPKPLADALEALLAAIYLDAHAAGADAAATVKVLVEARFLEDVRAARADTLTQRDPKTHLQETAARLGLAAPAYVQVGQAVPGHAPRFTMRATVGELAAEAEGLTRKRAESDAARKLLDLIAARSPS
jgi:ribonuclease-3